MPRLSFRPDVRLSFCACWVRVSSCWGGGAFAEHGAYAGGSGVQERTQSYHTEVAFTQAVMKELSSRTSYHLVAGTAPTRMPRWREPLPGSR